MPLPRGRFAQVSGERSCAPRRAAPCSESATPCHLTMLRVKDRVRESRALVLIPRAAGPSAAQAHCRRRSCTPQPAHTGLGPRGRSPIGAQNSKPQGARRGKLESSFHQINLTRTPGPLAVALCAPGLASWYSSRCLPEYRAVQEGGHPVLDLAPQRRATGSSRFAPPRLSAPLLRPWPRACPDLAQSVPRGWMLSERGQTLLTACPGRAFRAWVAPQRVPALVASSSTRQRRSRPSWPPLSARSPSAA
eukprot:scaffold62336_cov69-Phaeocystis_antarctica.AAC.3